MVLFLKYNKVKKIFKLIFRILSFNLILFLFFFFVIWFCIILFFLWFGFIFFYYRLKLCEREKFDFVRKMRFWKERFGIEVCVVGRVIIVWRDWRFIFKIWKYLIEFCNIKG